MLKSRLTGQRWPLDTQEVWESKVEEFLSMIPDRRDPDSEGRL